MLLPPRSVFYSFLIPNQCVSWHEKDSLIETTGKSKALLEMKSVR